MPFANLPDNLKMYYEDDCYADPWRTPETVVLHHGNAKNSALWYEWVPLLSRHYRVIRVDARGFGKSTVPEPGYNWSLSGFGNDLLALLDTLDLEKVHFVGETIGGTIGLQFAYEHSERLTSLTTCTSPYKFTGVPTYLEYHKLVKEEGVSSWIAKTANNRLEPGKSNPEHLSWYSDQMSQTSQHVVVETLAYLSTVDLTDVLPLIPTPTLVMVGKESAMNTLDRGKVMADLLNDGRLAEITGGSGYIQHSDPAACVAVWREFLGNLSH